MDKVHLPTPQLIAGILVLALRSRIPLAICQKIVESHSGKIRVESNPGGGTPIHFTLPQNPNDSSNRQTHFSRLFDTEPNDSATNRNDDE